MDVSVVEVLFRRLERKTGEFRLGLAAAQARLGSGCSDAAFGPPYWIPRCDGFRVLSQAGEQGEVDEIFTEDGRAVALSVRFRGRLERVERSRIVDVDAGQRLVVVTDPKNGKATKKGR